MVITETDATSAPAGRQRRRRDRPGQAVSHGLLDSALHGNAATYLYELVDSHPDTTNASPEAHYGLFRQDWSAKPAAVAIHNLTTILTTGPGDVFPARRSTTR